LQYYEKIVEQVKKLKKWKTQAITDNFKYSHFDVDECDVNAHISTKNLTIKYTNLDQMNKMISKKDQSSFYCDNFSADSNKS